MRSKSERIGEILSPSRVRTPSRDPVYLELDRLNIGLPNIRTRLYDAGKSRPTTSDERRNEKASAGPLLKEAYAAAISDSHYADLPDETKRELLDRVGHLPSEAIRWVGSRRADNTAPVDMVQRKVQGDLHELMAKAVSESNTGAERLRRSPKGAAEVVPSGTPVSPEVAAYLRQQRLDARRPKLTKTP